VNELWTISFKLSLILTRFPGFGILAHCLKMCWNPRQATQEKFSILNPQSWILKKTIQKLLSDRIFTTHWYFYVTNVQSKSCSNYRYDFAMKIFKKAKFKVLQTWYKNWQKSSLGAIIRALENHFWRYKHNFEQKFNLKKDRQIFQKMQKFWKFLKFRNTIDDGNQRGSADANPRRADEI
jgi:hypothetical protein